MQELLIILKFLLGYNLLCCSHICISFSFTRAPHGVLFWSRVSHIKISISTKFLESPNVQKF